MAAHYDNQRVALLLLDKGASPHSAAKVHTHSPAHRGWVAGLTLPCCMSLKSSVAIIDLTLITSQESQCAMCDFVAM